MKLNEKQLKEIDEKGYTILPDWYSNEEVNNLRKAMKIVFNEKAEANVVEKSSGEVRTAMGLHLPPNGLQNHNAIAKLHR